MSKLQAISDNQDAKTGLELVEVLTKLAYTPEDLRHALESVEPDTGLVVITSGLAAKCADIIEAFRGKNSLPLITIMPDPAEAGHL